MRIDTGGTIWQVNYFRDAVIGDLFWRNGNKWIKNSTRTAKMVYPDRFEGNWFYFSQNDVIETTHSIKETI